MLTRRGFSLVELLIALVLMGIVSAAVYRVLVNNQRVYQMQTQRIDLQQNIRAAATILPAEFRELDALDGDITAMSATSITIRAMRWLGFTCDPPVMGGAVGALTTTIRGGPLFFGSRGILTSDSILIYYDGNQASRLDDAWWAGRPTANPAALNCPTDGRPGTRIVFALRTAGAPAPPYAGMPPNFPGAIPPGAPVRGFETVTYQLYRPAGDTSWYVGMQPTGQAMQPLVGPVLANGLAFTYFNAAGAVTAVPAEVARIDITVRGRTAQLVRQTTGGVMGPTLDSVVTSVALRNNRRF
jgi:prepilin-type N-terminal cleavage/methylation domain-containing protein